MKKYIKIFLAATIMYSSANFAAAHTDAAVPCNLTGSVDARALQSAKCYSGCLSQGGMCTSELHQLRQVLNIAITADSKTIAALQAAINKTPDNAVTDRKLELLIEKLRNLNLKLAKITNPKNLPSQSELKDHVDAFIKKYNDTLNAEIEIVNTNYTSFSNLLSPLTNKDSSQNQLAATMKAWKKSNTDDLTNAQKKRLELGDQYASTLGGTLKLAADVNNNAENFLRNTNALNNALKEDPFNKAGEQVSLGKLSQANNDAALLANQLRSSNNLPPEFASNYKKAIMAQQQAVDDTMNSINNCKACQSGSEDGNVGSGWQAAKAAGREIGINENGGTLISNSQTLTTTASDIDKNQQDINSYNDNIQTYNQWNTKYNNPIQKIIGDIDTTSSTMATQIKNKKDSKTAGEVKTYDEKFKDHVDENSVNVDSFHSSTKDQNDFILAKASACTDCVTSAAGSLKDGENANEHFQKASDSLLASNHSASITQDNIFQASKEGNQDENTYKKLVNTTHKKYHQAVIDTHKYNNAIRHYYEQQKSMQKKGLGSLKGIDQKGCRKGQPGCNF